MSPASDRIRYCLGHDQDILYICMALIFTIMYLFVLDLPFHCGLHFLKPQQNEWSSGTEACSSLNEGVSRHSPTLFPQGQVLSRGVIKRRSSKLIHFVTRLAVASGY